MPILINRMAISTSSSEGALGAAGEDSPAEAPTRAFVVAAGGEACAHCGSTLSSDQRYCVVCGERRGRTRFPVAELATMRRQPVVDPATAVPPPRRFTLSGGTTLVTGIATLLLAMGVGVLIGRNGQNQKVAAAPSVITVNGGGGAATTSSLPTTTRGGQGKKPKPVKGPPSKTVIVKAQQQASKVLGGSNLPPPTVKVGQSGSGPGFQGGKFTGNFFGP